MLDVSVCIVTYHARDVLRDCLCSLIANTHLSYEVIVVDNHSQDGVGEMLQREFPSARFIETGGNQGYTRPMNIALRLGTGRYLLQLNPDTLILPEAIDRLAAFLDDNPQAGVCGPKVLNPDHTLQKSCRRGEPTPSAVISYFTGLSRAFPHSRFFSQYHMSYMDEDVAHAVAGVSGSCMLARREIYENLNFMDERFFAYQEDADFCRRVRDQGWQVFYYPISQIIHFGGLGGSRVQPTRAIIEWHRSYYRYYRKHLAKNYFFLFNALYYLAMLIKLMLALATNLFRTATTSGQSNS